MRCQSCEDHGFHDYRFCSCCGRPIAVSATADAERTVDRVVPAVADRPNAPGSTLTGKRCECCGGPWDGEGTLCAGCQRVFGRVLEAATKPSDVGAYHPPPRPSATQLPVVPPVPPLADAAGPAPAGSEAAEPVETSLGSAEELPRPWWDLPTSPVTPLPVPAPQVPVQPDSSRLTAILAVPQSLLPSTPAVVAAQTPQSKPVSSAPSPAPSARAAKPITPTRRGLAARTQRLLRAALGGIALVVILLLGVPALQSSRGWTKTRSTPGADAALSNSEAAADISVATPKASASGDSVPGSAATSSSVAPASSAPSAQASQPSQAGGALARSAQPPSRALRSSTKARTAPPKTTDKKDIAVVAPTAVVVPERTVDVPVQAAPTMASVAVVPVATLGQTYDAAQVDVRPRVESQVAAIVPEHLRQRAVDGVVVLRVRVSAAGQPADVQVLRKSGVDAALDAAAVAAVKKWRFSPARKRGETVNCWLNVGVPFRNVDHHGTR